MKCYGSLTVTGYEFIGYQGTGGASFTQTNGTHTVGTAGQSFALTLGQYANATGLYQMSGGTLVVNGNLIDGVAGRGTIELSGSPSATVTGGLTLGQAPGSYGYLSIAGGTLVEQSGDVHVGESGAGTFYQTGGTHAVGSNLVIGLNAGSVGQYFLNFLDATGNLSVGGNEVVGGAGNGSFHQTGGTSRVAGNLYLGQAAGSQGYYVMADPQGYGTLLYVAGNEYVGVATTGVNPANQQNQPSGTFEQDGGTNGVGSPPSPATLSVAVNAGSTALYLLTAGALNVTGAIVVGPAGNGNFQQSGGSATATTGRATVPGFGSFTGLIVGGPTAGGVGTYQLAGGTLTIGNGIVGCGGGSDAGGTGTLVQTGGTLTANTGFAVGSGGRGTVNVSAGTFTLPTAGTNLSVGATSGYAGTFIVGGTGALAVPELHVGDAGTGTFNQTAGTTSVSGVTYVGYSAGGTGTVAATGGALSSAGEIVVGFAGTGTVNQSGGTVSTPTLVAGYAAGGVGTYTLSANGTLNVTVNEYVGYGGAGTFNQSGGTHTVAGGLYVGSPAGPAAGTFTLSGGTVTAGGVAVASAAGSTNAWVQTGGTLTTSGGLSVGYDGNGTLNQSGGTVGVPANNLYVGSQVGGVGLYRLSGTATLNVVGQEVVGNAGTGSVVQTGGTNAVTSGSGQLVLGNYAGSTGSYSLVAGSLSTTGGEQVGLAGVGAFNQSGGTNAVGGSLQVGVNAVAGTYNLAAGALTVAVGESVASTAGSTFHQTGGTNTAGTPAAPNDLVVGNGTGTRGLFLLDNPTGSSRPPTLTITGNELLGLYGPANGVAAATGTFNQSAGTHSVAGTLFLGYGLGTTGTMTVTGGTLSVGGLQVAASAGTTGSLTYSGTAAIVVGGTTPAPGPSLTVAAAGTLFTYGAATITGAGPLVNNGTVHVTAGTLTLYDTAPFTNPGTFAVDAGATAEVFAAVAGAGTITNGGLLYLNAPAVVGTVTGTGMLNVGFGGSAVTARVAGMAVAQDAIAVFSGSTLDLGTAGLILHETSLTVATAQVAAGYAGGTWAGTGITSSAAAADARRLTAVGVVQDVTTPGGSTALYPTFAGQPAAATDVIARLTYYGDANLDGVVNGADYARIDAGYNGHGTLTGWANGDFNYDGRVDGSDYTLIDNAFNAQASALTPPPNGIVAASTAEVAAVPEPTGVVTAAAVALTLARRRRVTARTR